MQKIRNKMLMLINLGEVCSKMEQLRNVQSANKKIVLL